jgi:hypothetical protein
VQLNLALKLEREGQHWTHQRAFDIAPHRTGGRLVPDVSA